MQRLPAGALLGQNVRRLRQQQGLSVDVLATRLGWSKEKLVAVEDGTLDLDLDSVDTLSIALKSSQQQLFASMCEDTMHLHDQRYG